MTVKELIEKLDALQMPDARVVTSGFDGDNYEDINPPKIKHIIFDDARMQFHGGRHIEDDKIGVAAIVLDWT